MTLLSRAVVGTRFGLVVVAVDEYLEMPPLPSKATGARLAEMLRPHGSELLAAPEETTVQPLREHLQTWAGSETGPASSFVYWVGHGESDGKNQWFLTSRSKQPYNSANSLAPAELANFLVLRWLGRVADDPDAWTVLVLDCCNPSVGSLDIISALLGHPAVTPKRIAVIPIASGASTVGRFVDVLGQVLATKTEFDDRIELHSLLGDVMRELDEDLTPIVWLPRDAAITNPQPAARVTATTLDVRAEWLRLVDGLPEAVREHFVARAQSAELGELAWHFSGRRHEARRLATWLDKQQSGMLVVTGEPGAGKSALLGQVVILSDERLSAVLAGLLADRPADERPPPGVFDAVVHLTGKTFVEALAAIAAAVPEPRPDDAGALIGVMRSMSRRLTILVDALDEAQEPMAIAREILVPLARLPNVRVVVGTRRSLLEGPDLPAPPTDELLSSLGVTLEETMNLQREPEAMAEYARKRLATLPPEVVEAVVSRVGVVDQPFLFVRLATSELLSESKAGRPLNLDRLLSGGHRDVFERALERLARSSPASVTLLRALALGYGRGLPRTGWVWATIAEVLDPEVRVTEALLDDAIRLAAAYVTLDGEAGQSVYRLAHKTFAEHFHAEEDAEDVNARITRALRALVDISAGWPRANSYVLLHILEHAASDTTELEVLCTDPGFLNETLRRFGVDALVQLLRSAGRHSFSPVVDVVSGALRRARVALARDPDQLASQLHARLRSEADPALSGLVARLAEIAPPMWLRTLTDHLTWASDVETLQAFPGPVRAISFGEINETTVLAVAAGPNLHLWDPRAGSPPTASVSNDGTAIVGVSLGTVRDRPVAVIASRAWAVTLRDVESGAAIVRLDDVVASCVCVGRVAGHDLIVAGDGRHVWWWDTSGRPLGARDFGEAFIAMGLLATPFGVLVALADNASVRVWNLEDSNPLDSWQHAFGNEPLTVALGEVANDLLVVLGHNRMVLCRQITESGAIPVGLVEADFYVRCVAAARIDETLVLAAGKNAHDDEGLGFVTLRNPNASYISGYQWSLYDIVAVARTPIGLACVPDGAQLQILSVPDGEVLTDRPTPSEVAEVITGGAYPSLIFVDAHESSGNEYLNFVATRGMPEQMTRSDPRSWPVTGRAYGVYGGRPVVAQGSYGGAVWVWDLESEDLLAGPFANVPDSYQRDVVMAKPALPAVRNLSLCTSGRQTLLGTVCSGVGRVWDVATTAPLVVPDLGGCSAIAVGDTGKRLVVARGSDSGSVRVWDLTSHEYLAGITLDSPVRDVWLVRGEATVVAMTSSEVHIFDFS